MICPKPFEDIHYGVSFMATMIPANVETFITEGEKQFYRFLESAAKPDSKYIAWYTPDLKGKEPDFILFSDKVGLIVFEVKDWALEQIREANPQHFIQHHSIENMPSGFHVRVGCCWEGGINCPLLPPPMRKAHSNFNRRPKPDIPKGDILRDGVRPFCQAPQNLRANQHFTRTTTFDRTMALLREQYYGTAL